jgi:glutamine amidotransferase
MIAIVDYGMGNLHSVKKALESLGAKTSVVDTPQALKLCEKIILPGVGAFADAMAELDKRGFSEQIKQQISEKKLFLGICLGMQLLFPESEEALGCRGLGILKGRIRKFKASGLKVPHIGWNQLELSRPPGRQASGDCPLLKGLAKAEYVYFCHSYYAQPDDPGVIAATTSYGIDFASLIWQDNLYGTQFHPEKSQQAGLKILANFVRL